MRSGPLPSEQATLPFAPRHPTPPGLLTVDCITDPAQLAQLAPEWDLLVDDERPGAIFRSPGWLLPWWNNLASQVELRVYIARVGHRLVGLLPAYRAPTPLGGTRLRLMGDGIVGSDYLGVIARIEDLDAATLAIAREIVATEPDLACDGVDSKDPLVAALAREAGKSHAAFRCETLLPCPYIDIANAGPFDRWLAHLPEGAGAQLRRRRRWLEKQSGYRMEVVSSAREIGAAIDVLFQLHEARWARGGGSDAVDGGAVLAFHREAAQWLARRGQARVYLLHADGAPRAALYALSRGRRVAFYQSGNDPAWRQRSVGTVVLGASIEDAFARGAVEYDFLRGAERYKAVFADSRRQLVRIRVATDLRARSLLAAQEGMAVGRGLIKRALPSDAVEWFRRTRRRLSRAATPAGLTGAAGTLATAGADSADSGAGSGPGSGPGSGVDG